MITFAGESLCITGWTKFENSCYRNSEGSDSFNFVASLCNFVSPVDIVEIDSADENDFIKAL